MDRDDLRRNMLPFTDRAFGLLPPMDEPRILDIGCGTGLPTLRLAELSGGTIVALDVDEEALGKLRASRRYLRPSGCLVAHDEAGDLRKKLLEADGEGYTALGVVEVPESVWWDEYFSPLIGVPELAEEIRRFRECPARFRSAFFVLTRKEETC